MDDRPVVIFGNLRSSSLARYCLDNDTAHRVVAYTVDEAYISSPTYEGLPLLPFEQLDATFPPSDIRLLIPMGYQKINTVRREKFLDARRRGYDFISYVSSRASTWPDLHIEDNVLVYEHAIIQPFATIGENAIIRSGAHISHHCSIGPHCFVAAEVAMGGDCKVGEQSFLGVGSVLRDQLTVASRTFVGAGAVVVKDTEENGVYVGNPAQKTNRQALDVT